MKVIHKYLDKVKGLKNIVSFSEKCPNCLSTHVLSHSKKRMICWKCGKTFNKGLTNVRTIETIMFDVLRRNNVYINSEKVRQVQFLSLIEFKKLIKNKKNTYIIAKICCDKNIILNPTIHYIVIENDKKRLQKDRESKLKRLTNEN